MGPGLAAAREGNGLSKEVLSAVHSPQDEPTPRLPAGTAALADLSVCWFHTYKAPSWQRENGTASKKGTPLQGHPALPPEPSSTALNLALKGKAEGCRKRSSPGPAVEDAVSADAQRPLAAKPCGARR